jgi:predicted Zn-dependent protease
LVLQLASEGSAREAAVRFFGQQGVQEGSPWRDQINGLPAVTRSFGATRTEGELRGVVGFIEAQGRVFQLLAYTSAERANQVAPAFLDWLGSFRPVTDRRVLEVTPRRVRLLRLSTSGPLAQAPELRGKDVAELELLNNLDPGESVAAGTTIKTIEGALP